MFANLSIGKKLSIGFGAILSILIVVGFLSSSTLQKSSNGFDEYRSLARDTNLAGLVQGNLLMIRINVNDFITTSSAKNLNQYQAYWDKTRQFLETAQAEIKNPKRANLIDKIDDMLQQYNKSFRQVVDLINQREELVKEGIDKTGPPIERQLTQILSSAKQDGDMMAAYRSSLAARNLLLARLYAGKFLDTNDQSAVERVTKEFSEMEETLKSLDREIQNLTRRELLSQVIIGVKTYRKTFAQVVQVIKNRNSIINNQLNVFGPELATMIEQVKLSVKGDQDILGPKLQAENHKAVGMILSLIVLALIGGIGATIIIVRNITKPIIEGVNFAHGIAQGDFSQRIEAKHRDEIGLLINELNNMADSLATNAKAAQQIAEKNLDVKIQLASEKDELGKSLQMMVEGLNDSLGQVQSGSEQIASAATEIADSSQTLSQGATETASSLEEISSSLEELSSQTKINADNAIQANSLANTAADSAKKGNSQMQNMVSAMDEIKDASQNISKIIKTIDEIAFQTNLLALNAAVEAARAGQHGKGFAVVAEEVRNLAARSAKAAEETSQLIEGSVDKTNNGSMIANQTAEALQEIVVSIGKVTDLVSEITIASKEQAEGVNQISIGVTQIDQVTQQNTATAEESAAASEELSGQALQMQEMVRHFKLRQQGTMSHKLPESTITPSTQKARPSQYPASNWDDMAKQSNESSLQIALDDNDFGKY